MLTLSVHPHVIDETHSNKDATNKTISDTFKGMPSSSMISSRSDIVSFHCPQDRRNCYTPHDCLPAKLASNDSNHTSTTLAIPCIASDHRDITPSMTLQLSNTATPRSSSLLSGQRKNYHRISKDGYHTGTFTVYDDEIHCFPSFSAHDFGQFPWGRSKTLGNLEVLCNMLNISTSHFPYFFFIFWSHFPVTTDF